MATPRCARYSSESASQTLEWMDAIADFLAPFRLLMDAHVVNFFKDRLWETVDEDWIRCLRREPVENLLNIPSGMVMEHWPTSLRQFILTLKSLVIYREQESLNEMFPNLHITPLGSVLAQGMNMKKKHEVEILGAVVSDIANGLGAHNVIDVGAGQGYLAQVLSFEHQLSVIAIDASSHHSLVTSKRAERIKRYYTAKLRKSLCGDEHLNVPKAVTCHVLSSSALSALSMSVVQNNLMEQVDAGKTVRSEDLNADTRKGISCEEQNSIPSMVLAGLHACGDLSVNMLRTFFECEQIKALVCIGCCYNLLSEEGFQSLSTPCGFPMSNGAKLFGMSLGKNARDLACQSAERWGNLSKDAALQNFDLHIFRAVFQMVLDKYYPGILFSNPSIGRQGKALRRQKMWKALHLHHGADESPGIPSTLAKDHDQRKAQTLSMKSHERDTRYEDMMLKAKHLFKDVDIHSTPDVASCGCGTECGSSRTLERCDKYALLKEFCMAGLGRLKLELTEDFNLLSVWKEAQPFLELVGPYWSLRAALGPLLETYLLLDRLLFLQEQGGSVEVMMFPLFDPVLSPRNIVIIAQK